MAQAPRLIPTKKGWILPPDVVKLNIAFDKLMKSGVMCGACARKFSETIKRDTKMPDVCEECAKAF